MTTDSQQLATLVLAKPVAELVLSTIPTCNPDDTVQQVALKMCNLQLSYIFVQDEDQIVGIWTESDAKRMLLTQQSNVLLPVSLVMSSPVISIKASAAVGQAMALMKQRNIRNLLVTSTDGAALGVITQADLIRFSAERLHLAHQVIEASYDAIMITDADGVITSVNPSFSMLTGYTAQESVGQRASLLSSGMHDTAFYQQLWQSLLQHGYWQGEVWNKRKNGEIYPQWLSISAIRGETGIVTQYAAIFSDISERKRREQQIHELAYYDDLTGLANRRLFLDRLEQALATARRHNHLLMVMFLDLDLFKRINDTLGHAVGDEALRQVAERLKLTIRAGESVARLGGDEFTILMPECSSTEDASELAKRLIAQFNQPFNLLGHILTLTTSIGISVYPDDAPDAVQLLKHADTAMYQAKYQGRNSYSFYQSVVGQQCQLELKLEQELRIALQLKQLNVHYQPIIILADGNVSYLEALVRWQHPTLGNISPDQFITLAERLGLINALGMHVLDQVVRQLVSWGIHAVPVAVNLSPLQLNDKQFLPQLKQLLFSSGVNPELLRFEITESCLLPEYNDTTTALLHELRQLGISLALDDFGTGYSSLSYLRHLPIQSVKIDRSFIKELPQNISDQQITLAIIALAKALNLTVVAEGIETQAQHQFLTAAGSQFGQGYFYSKAVPAEEILPLLYSQQR